MTALYGRLAMARRCSGWCCGDPMLNRTHSRLRRRSVRLREKRTWRKEASA